MGFVGLLKFALKYVTFLAWPLVALAYPLWVSIRVIETQSIALMQKLIAYWISFSVILLFEHAFGKLIEWLSFWCYIRLVIIVFLVMHEFAGSLYVYEHIVCPCLSVNLETLNMVVNKAKKPFNKKDTFLTQLEKYVNKNGTEVLENLIATKVGSHPGDGKNEINTVTKVEQPKLAEPKVESKDISTVEATDEKEGSSIKPISLIEPKLPSAKTNVFAPPNPIGIPIQAKECTGLLLEECKETGNAEEVGRLVSMMEEKAENYNNQIIFGSFTYQPQEQDMKPIIMVQAQSNRTCNPAIFSDPEQLGEEISLIEPKLPSAKTNVFAPPNPIGIPIQAKEWIGLPNKPFPRNVQKRWTCALCCVTTRSESDLASHLQGRRHRAALEDSRCW